MTYNVFGGRLNIAQLNSSFLFPDFQLMNLTSNLETV